MTAGARSSSTTPPGASPPVTAMGATSMTEPLFESAMHCPECGSQFCPNCFGALCDCDTPLYRHDVSHCGSTECPDCQGTGVVHVETGCGGCSGYPGIAHEPACGREPCPRGCEVRTTAFPQKRKD
jgi:hypothetical protein